MKVFSIVCSFILISLSSSQLRGQSFWFGPQGGVGIVTQQGSGFSNQAAFAGHVGFFMETYSEEELPGALYASLGLHQRGGGLRSFRTFDNLFVPSISFIYNNVSLQVGIKKFANTHFYYKVGIRGEYTAFTNLDEASGSFSSPNFPINEYVVPVTAGISGGAGYQYNIADLYGVAIEFSIHPDFFNQYRSPEIPNVINPVTNTLITVPARQIRNTSIELTLSMRFLRKVIYY